MTPDEIKRTEARIQQEIVMEFRNRYCLAHHVPRMCIFSIPNDGKDGKEQSKKRSTGLLSGASDLELLLPNITLFIEVKTPIGVQSDSQKEFQKTVEALGFVYFIVRSKEEFWKKMGEYLVD